MPGGRGLVEHSIRSDTFSSKLVHLIIRQRAIENGLIVCDIADFVVF